MIVCISFSETWALFSGLPNHCNPVVLATIFVQRSALLQLSRCTSFFEAEISDGVMNSTYGGGSSSSQQGYCGISSVGMGTMVDSNQPMYMDLPTTEAELDIEPLEVIENEPLHIPWPRFLSQSSSQTPQLVEPVSPPVLSESTVETWNQLLELQKNMFQAQLQIWQLGQAVAQSEVPAVPNFDPKPWKISPQADSSLGHLGRFDQKDMVDTQQSQHGSAETDDPFDRGRMVRIPVVDVNKYADHTRGKKTKGMKFMGFEGPSRRKQEKHEMRNRQAAANALGSMSSSSTEISASHPPFQLQ